MENKIFNKEKGNKSFIVGSLKLNKFNKFGRLYDPGSNNTVVMLNMERATACESKDFYEYMSKLIEKN